MNTKKRIKTSRSKRRSPEGLPVLRPNAAGLDIGSREVWACAAPCGEIQVARFDTTTGSLEALAEWLLDAGVDTVAMESTGVYWIPVFDVLETRGLEVILVDARQAKGVPGRKTDVLDCQWIRLLHACGLLKGCFRPADDIRALRSLVREQAELVSERSTWLRRMQKSLDQMNIRVHHAVSDISGATGMRILRAIADGERDPMVLASLRDPSCRKSLSEIAECLRGTWREEHLFNLKSALALYDHLNQYIARYDQEILSRLESMHPEEHREAELPKLTNANKEALIRKRGDAPMREALFRLHGVDLCTIDAINVETALMFWSEIGSDLSAFASEKHFVSYIRLAPHLAVSGGKPVRGKKKRPGPSPRLAQGLRMAATSLRRSKTALGAEYRRYAAIKGASHAVFIMARKLAILIYRMVRWGQAYVDIGMEAKEAQYNERRLRGIEESAKQLGYRILPLGEA